MNTPLSSPPPTQKPSIRSNAKSSAEQASPTHRRGVRVPAGGGACRRDRAAPALDQGYRDVAVVQAAVVQVDGGVVDEGEGVIVGQVRAGFRIEHSAGWTAARGAVELETARNFGQAENAHRPVEHRAALPPPR